MRIRKPGAVQVRVAESSFLSPTPTPSSHQRRIAAIYLDLFVWARLLCSLVRRHSLTSGFIHFAPICFRSWDTLSLADRGRSISCFIDVGQTDRSMAMGKLERRIQTRHNYLAETSVLSRGTTKATDMLLLVTPWLFVAIYLGKVISQRPC